MPFEPSLQSISILLYRCLSSFITTFDCAFDTFVRLFLFSLLSALQVVANLLKLARKEHARLVVAPYQHANLVREAARVLVLLGVVKVAKQEPARRLHALILQLPQADLVDDGGRQHRLVGERRGAVHLLVRVRGEVRDDLVGRDAELDGLPDRRARDAAGHHVGEAHVELGEEREHGNLQRRLRVRVQAVVGLDDDGARLLAGAAERAAAVGRAGLVLRVALATTGESSGSGRGDAVADAA